MLAYERTRDEKWLGWLRRVHEYIYTHLCDARGGGEWFGYLRADNSVFNACKGGNYKGFFHVPRCLLLSWRAAQRCQRAGAHEARASSEGVRPAGTPRHFQKGDEWGACLSQHWLRCDSSGGPA